MRPAKLLFLLLVTNLLVACEGIIGVKGILIDEETGAPIPNAVVCLNNGLNTVSTDSLGHFAISQLVGMVRPIYPKISCTKEGYKPFELEICNNPKKEIRSYHVKSNTINVNLDEPFYPDTNNQATYLVTLPIEEWSQNFMIRNDSVIIYLKKTPSNEVEESKKKIINNRRN